MGLYDWISSRRVCHFGQSIIYTDTLCGWNCIGNWQSAPIQRNQQQAACGWVHTWRMRNALVARCMLMRWQTALTIDSREPGRHDHRHHHNMHSTTSVPTYPRTAHHFNGIHWRCSNFLIWKSEAKSGERRGPLRLIAPSCGKGWGLSLPQNQNSLLIF